MGDVGGSRVSGLVNGNGLFAVEQTKEARKEGGAFVGRFSVWEEAKESSSSSSSDDDAGGGPY
jgi:hypothetical protein